jgi:DNA-binding MarR family transcriptional regulator
MADEFNPYDLSPEEAAALRALAAKEPPERIPEAAERRLREIGLIEPDRLKLTGAGWACVARMARG